MESSDDARSSAFYASKCQGKMMFVEVIMHSFRVKFKGFILRLLRIRKVWVHCYIETKSNIFFAWTGNNTARKLFTETYWSSFNSERIFDSLFLLKRDSLLLSSVCSSNENWYIKETLFKNPCIQEMSVHTNTWATLCGIISCRNKESLFVELNTLKSYHICWLLLWYSLQGQAAAQMTCIQLHKRAERIGCMLMDKAKLNTGNHVALLYPPGLDLICAFYGCLYAGAFKLRSVLKCVKLKTCPTRSQTTRLYSYVYP